MASIETSPILEADLPALAEFIHTYELEAQRDVFGESTRVRSAAENMAFLRWALVANPVQLSNLGFQLRTHDGQLVGFHPVCPFRFRWSNRRLMGLASSSFFAAPQVRLQAFSLFKRFLSLSGADFYFANSCNFQSGQLWARCGGQPVPGTETDWLVPIHLGPLVREVLAKRRWKLIAGPTSFAADLFNPWLRWCNSKGATCRIQPTDDLDLLVELSERYRLDQYIAPDRNLDYFRWVYHSGQAVETKRLYRFDDSASRAGWAAVAFKNWGLEQNIRLAILIDWSVPSENFDFAELIRAVIHEISDQCDVFAFRLRLDLPILPQFRFLHQYQYTGPKGYLIPARGDQPGLEKIILMNRADSV